ncbi:hypothetical protein SNEBB_009215 [Seison nebaliae]|nr:hypothetical protein SNEBB_009215 [Seison nebaliae]
MNEYVVQPLRYDSCSMDQEEMEKLEMRKKKLKEFRRETIRRQREMRKRSAEKVREQVDKGTIELAKRRAFILKATMKYQHGRKNFEVSADDFIASPIVSQRKVKSAQTLPSRRPPLVPIKLERERFSSIDHIPKLESNKRKWKLKQTTPDISDDSSISSIGTLNSNQRKRPPKPPTHPKNSPKITVHNEESLQYHFPRQTSTPINESIRNSFSINDLSSINECEINHCSFRQSPTSEKMMNSWQKDNKQISEKTFHENNAVMGNHHTQHRHHFYEKDYHDSFSNGKSRKDRKQFKISYDDSSESNDLPTGHVSEYRKFFENDISPIQPITTMITTTTTTTTSSSSLSSSITYVVSTSSLTSPNDELLNNLTTTSTAIINDVPPTPLRRSNKYLKDCLPSTPSNDRDECLSSNFILSSSKKVPSPSTSLQCRETGGIRTTTETSSIVNEICSDSSPNENHNNNEDFHPFADLLKLSKYRSDNNYINLHNENETNENPNHSEDKVHLKYFINSTGRPVLKNEVKLLNGGSEQKKSLKGILKRSLSAEPRLKEQRIEEISSENEKNIPKTGTFWSNKILYDSIDVTRDRNNFEIQMNIPMNYDRIKSNKSYQSFVGYNDEEHKNQSQMNYEKKKSVRFADCKSLNNIQNLISSMASTNTGPLTPIEHKSFKSTIPPTSPKTIPIQLVDEIELTNIDEKNSKEKGENGKPKTISGTILNSFRLNTKYTNQKTSNNNHRIRRYPSAPKSSTYHIKTNKNNDNNNNNNNNKTNKRNDVEEKINIKSLNNNNNRYISENIQRNLRNVLGNEKNKKFIPNESISKDNDVETEDSKSTIVNNDEMNDDVSGKSIHDSSTTSMKSSKNKNSSFPNGKSPAGTISSMLKQSNLLSNKSTNGRQSRPVVDYRTKINLIPYKSTNIHRNAHLHNQTTDSNNGSYPNSNRSISSCHTEPIVSNNNGKTYCRTPTKHPYNNSYVTRLHALRQYNPKREEQLLKDKQKREKMKFTRSASNNRNNQSPKYSTNKYCHTEPTESLADFLNLEKRINQQEKISRKLRKLQNETKHMTELSIEEMKLLKSIERLDRQIKD